MLKANKDSSEMLQDRTFRQELRVRQTISTEQSCCQASDWKQVYRMRLGPSPFLSVGVLLLLTGGALTNAGGYLGPCI